MIYTKTGDTGTTSLAGGKRVSKASLRLQAYGAIDELNASIGLLLARGSVPDNVASELNIVQNKLFNIGARLATEPEALHKPEGLAQADVERIEHAIDAVQITLPAHDRFILPGGTISSAEAGMARTIARRAEREIIALKESGAEVDPEILAYVNRLSDFLFVISRMLNIIAGRQETFWDKNC